MAKISRLTVYCGSSPGADPGFAEAARELGAVLARREITLVYGAGNVGLMGVIADAVLEHGGAGIGVIPFGLSDKELAHEGLSELHVVDTMHERKQMMVDQSDAMLALPGGIGTLEEIAEALTWAVLGIHHKPCGLWNVNGYYDHLLAFLDHAVDQGLLTRPHRDLLLVSDKLDTLLAKMEAYAPPANHWRRRPVVP